MADIDVVKKGSRAWVWMLMLIALVLILWFVMTGSNPPQTGLMFEEREHVLQGAVGTMAGTRV